ncbi:hypothetical protein K227x_46120 [Rubripirellula lacrimiformis]|uniref:FlgN protein n=1 Tax=Rubripirellula lacrimiformis TaxID=1930273 RepID=A0A517NGE3_9BACT|nr:hypothetical protein [Rubripirellula lacrimiformis]QDT06204.1 hypothetical protein K227x_46120 [Rubripirellula lacrimiformis]
MTWSNRVERYLNELEETANTIDLILDQTRVQTVAVQPGQIDESTRQLQAALAVLEEKIAEREELLRDPDAPPSGLTLTKKLMSSLKIEDARLALRCRDLASTIELAHTRAVSLFVCQFHLSNLTTELVQTLTGATAPQTYPSPNGEKAPSSGGGLFDEAA